MHERLQNILMPFMLAGLLFAAKASLLNLPYHWDEMGAYVEPTLDFAQGGLAHVLLGWRPGPDFFGHPPVLYLSLAGAFNLLGRSILVAHLYALAWAFLTLWYTYRLGRLLHSRAAGLLAAVLLLAMPVFFAQTGLVNGDMPIAALGLMTAYYALRGRYALSVLFASLAVLTKETALALVVAAALYVALFQPPTRQRPTRRRAVLYLIPILLLGSYYLWQRIETGLWLANPYFDHSHHALRQSLTAILNHGKWVLQWTFIEQGRVALLVLVTAALAASSNLRRREYVLFGLVFVLFLAPFSALFFMRRYIVPVLPWLATLGGIAIATLVAGAWRRTIVAAVVALALLASLRPRETGYMTFDYDLQYADMVAIHRDAADYLQQHHPHARILAAWPLDRYLQNPEYGYVAQPLNVISAHKIDTPPHQIDLFFRAPNTDLYGPEYDRLVPARKTTLLQRFEHRGKTLLLYAVEPD